MTKTKRAEINENKLSCSGTCVAWFTEVKRASCVFVLALISGGDGEQIQLIEITQ